MSEDGNSFEDSLRAMARELSQSVERAMEHIDLDDIAGMVGVDPQRAREWAQDAGSWLRQQAEGFDPSAYRPPRPDTPAPRRDTTPSPAPDGFPTAAPHPLDLPTEEQGVALAALDSGRWTVEPGTQMLTSRGQGPGPSDALGLVRELRVRDWIAEDGEVTRAGRRALDRWLDASASGH
jgi:hypothetical protein